MTKYVLYLDDIVISLLMALKRLNHTDCFSLLIRKSWSLWNWKDACPPQTRSINLFTLFIRTDLKSLSTPLMLYSIWRNWQHNRNYDCLLVSAIFRHFVPNFARISFQLAAGLGSSQAKNLENLNEEEQPATSTLKEKLILCFMLALLENGWYTLNINECDQQIGCVLCDESETTMSGNHLNIGQRSWTI